MLPLNDALDRLGLCQMLLARGYARQTPGIENTRRYTSVEFAADLSTKVP